MRIFTIAVVACGVLLPGGQRSQAGTVYFSKSTDVTALADGVNVGYANASHGFVAGNNIGSVPTLIQLLNEGSTENELFLADDFTNGPPSIGKGSVPFYVSKTGMFSTESRFIEELDTINDAGDVQTAPIQTVDSLQGVKINTTQAWEYLGTTEVDDLGNSIGGPFKSIVNTTSGELVLDIAIDDDDVDAALKKPLNGTYVLALKSNSAYAVYAFQSLAEVTSFSFTWNESDFDSGLSHASLYYGGTSTSHAPEPSSWAIVGLAALGMVSTVARRRNQLPPQLA